MEHPTIRGLESWRPLARGPRAVVWEAQDSYNTLENKALFTQGMYGELRYFLDCVLEGRAAELSTLEFARNVMQVFEAALQSDGSPVTIES